MLGQYGGGCWYRTRSPRPSGAIGASRRLTKNFWLDELIAAATLSIRTAASGAARTHTIALITPEQADEAVRRDADYRPAGA